METITNLANTAANAASKLVYGEPAANTTNTTNTANVTNDTTAAATTKTNETAGREPISGELGRGTASEPYDQGNAATPLEKASGGSNTFLDYSNFGAGGQEPVSGVLGKGTASQPYDQGNTANSGRAFREQGSYPTGSDSRPYGGSESTGMTDRTGVSDKVWKGTPVDNVSTSVITDAPVDPETSHTRPAADHPFETTGSESLRQSTNPFTNENSNFDPVEKSSFSPISSVPVATRGSHGDSAETSTFGSTNKSPYDSTEKSTFGSTDRSPQSSTGNTGAPVPVEKVTSTPTGSSGLPAVDTPPVEYKYEGSGTPVSAAATHDSGAVKSSNTGFEKAIQNSSPATSTSTGLAHDSSKPFTSNEPNRLAGDKSSHNYGSTTSSVPASSSAANTTSDGRESKVSHLKEKFMDKLHIGHK